MGDDPTDRRPVPADLGGGYTLEEPLGSGAMGVVWRARRRADDALVAVKLVRPEMVEDDKILERFLRERRALLAVRGPHVLKLLDLVVQGDTLALVTEHAPDGDLRRWLHGRGPLPPDSAAALLAQLLDGLAEVHAAGVVHRDVKPANILLRESDDGGLPTLLLGDFGIAHLAGTPGLTTSGKVVGTPYYLAPELAQGARPTPAADLYSAGIVGYELLTGSPPFSGDHPLAILRAHAQDPPTRPSHCPEPLWQVVAALLAKDPEDRPPSATAARDRLRAAPPITGMATVESTGPTAQPNVRNPAAETPDLPTTPTTAPTALAPSSGDLPTAPGGQPTVPTLSMSPASYSTPVRVYPFRMVPPSIVVTAALAAFAVAAVAGFALVDRVRPPDDRDGDVTWLLAAAATVVAVALAGYGLYKVIEHGLRRLLSTRRTLELHLTADGIEAGIGTDRVRYRGEQLVAVDVGPHPNGPPDQSVPALLVTLVDGTDRGPTVHLVTDPPWQGRLGVDAGAPAARPSTPSPSNRTTRLAACALDGFAVPPGDIDRRAARVGGSGGRAHVDRSKASG